MSFFEKAAELYSRRIDFVTVTLLSTRGHAPQDPGAKALITSEGLFEGTIGGGKLEAKAIRMAQDFLLPGNEASFPLRLIWNLQRDVGMSCGGEVEILFELHKSNPWPILVFGAGHVAQAMVRLLLTMNCSVTCVDQRADWLEKLPSSPRLKRVLKANLADFFDELESCEHFYVVVMTMGHATDLPVLQKLLSRSVPRYVGVLGSEVKSTKIRSELRGFGIPQERIDALSCPMGLLRDTNDPAEIAISIAAELLQRRNQLSVIR